MAATPTAASLFGSGQVCLQFQNPAAHRNTRVRDGPGTEVSEGCGSRALEWTCGDSWPFSIRLQEGTADLTENNLSPLGTCTAPSSHLGCFNLKKLFLLGATSTHALRGQSLLPTWSEVLSHVLTQ